MFYPCTSFPCVCYTNLLTKTDLFTFQLSTLASVNDSNPTLACSCLSSFCVQNNFWVKTIIIVVGTITLLVLKLREPVNSAR